MNHSAKFAYYISQKRDEAQKISELHGDYSDCNGGCLGCAYLSCSAWNEFNGKDAIDAIKKEIEAESFLYNIANEPEWPWTRE